MSDRCWRGQPGRVENRERDAAGAATFRAILYDLHPGATWVDGVHLAAFTFRFDPHRKECVVMDVVVASVRPAPQGDPSRPRPRAHRLRPQRPPLPEHHAHRARRPRGVALVLLVDDSLDVREMYSQYLSYRGFSVITAAEGSQGIELALAARPDVIVMDVAMPNMTGTAATQRLKNHPRTRNIPVVILTGHPFSAIEQGALEAGAAMVLTKPCLPEDLEERVRSLLGPAG